MKSINKIKIAHTNNNTKGDHKLFFSTVRQTPGQEGTILKEKRKPNQMTPEASTHFRHHHEHVDHVVDALDILVLQNDHREPVLECLIQEKFQNKMLFKLN